MGACNEGCPEREAIARHEEALSKADDVDLLSMAIAGDPEAEDLVFDHLRRRMLAVARQALRTADVEDVVQDVLVVVHRKYPELVARAKLQDDAGFERWWRRILYHRVGNDIRRRRLEYGRCVSADHLSTIAAADAPDRGCAAAELRAVVLRAIRRLKASQRSLVIRGAALQDRPADSGSRNARYARVYRLRKALREAVREAGFLNVGIAFVAAAVS